MFNIFRNRYYFSLYVILLLAVLLVPAWWLSINNDNWLPPEHPQEMNLNYLSDEFAPGDDLVVGLQFPNGFFTAQNLKKLSKLEEALVLYLGRDLISHRSALSAQRIVDNKGVVLAESFGKAHQRGAFPTLEAYKQAFDKSPYYGRLLSLEHKVGALHLRLDTRGDAQKRARVIDKVRAVLNYQGYQAGQEYHFIAKAALKNEMNSQTQSALPFLLGGAILILGAFLWLVLGKFLPSLFVLSVAGLCVFGALSSMVVLGHEMSVVSIILPVLAAIIAIAHGLHIIFYQKNQPQTDRTHTLFYMWKPCLLANATTAIGTGSFIFAGLLPLENFGWDAIVTLILIYLSVMTSFWLLPYWQVGASQNADNNGNTFLQRVALFFHRASEKYKKEISFIGLGLVLFFMLGLVRFSTETNFLEVFFKAESQIRQDFALADAHLGGSGAIDLIIKHEEQDKFKQLDAFNDILLLTDKLSKHAHVNYIETMDIPIGLAHKAFTGKAALPNSDSQLAQELLFLELSRSESKDDILSPYVNFDYSASRIHLRTPDLSSEEIEETVKEMEAIIGSDRRSGEIILTGFNIFMSALGQEVLETQLSSLALTLGIIFFIFLFIFGLRLGSLGFLSNFVSIGILLGMIAWLGVHFDVVMVLVASITLGLMVDDSIHFLHRFKKSREEGLSGYDARGVAFFITGAPIILTSVLFCLGLVIFLFSDLALMVKFGTWVMVGLLIDLLSSILFLPALIAFWGEGE